MTLVFGKEPRVFGELHEHGNPASFHPEVGTPKSDVARRMRFRYHAKMEFIKAQAKNMLGRSVHARTRKLVSVEVGQQVFFWRDDSKKVERKELTGRVPDMLLVFRVIMCGSHAVVGVFWWLGNI